MYETIIVAFEEQERAVAAAEAVRRLGVPASHIVSQAPRLNVRPVAGGGFWSRLFAGDSTERQVAECHADLAAQDPTGSGMVLVVHVLDDELERVRSVVELFEPLVRGAPRRGERRERAAFELPASPGPQGT